MAFACGAFAVACASGTSRTAGPQSPTGSIPHWVTLARAQDGGAVWDGGVDLPDSGSTVAVGRCPSIAVAVPGGSFEMGSPQGVGAPDEHPRHTVTLRPYCIDRTEVTVDAYTRCVASRACLPASGSQALGTQPATGIDWQQATAFCRHVGGRLPTEAEWEFAARGTDGRRYPWGDDAPTDCARLDWTPRDNSCAGVGPAAVGTYPAGASPVGAMDMAGNVWEWTADWYATAYTTGPATDPTGPDTGSARVTRGGGWNNDQVDRLTSTFRQGEHPAFHDYDLGVRCAYEVAPETAAAPHAAH